MIFHENRLLADNFSRSIIPYFFRKLEKMSQNVLSAAVMIGALRVNICFGCSKELPPRDGSFEHPKHMFLKT